jgi:hypothetical protein
MELSTGSAAQAVLYERSYCRESKTGENKRAAVGSPIAFAYEATYFIN